MEDLQQQDHTLFKKMTNEDVFLDSLLDLLDEWNDELSSKTSLSENSSNDDDIMMDKTLPLIESPCSYIPLHAQEINIDKNTSNQIAKITNVRERLCHICGEKAGKHVYYGGQCCPSCRAFFRRSVQNNFYKQFVCTSQTNSCVINIQTRKGCQLCRFQKCLSSGMKVAWVLPDGERTSRKLVTKNALLALEHPGGLNYKEISFVFTIKNAFFNKFLENVTFMISEKPEFLIDFVDYLGSPSRAELAYLRVAMDMEKAEFLSLISSGFNANFNLSQNDLLALYERNYQQIFLFREVCFISRLECPLIEKLINSLKALNVESDQIIEKIPKHVRFNIYHFILNYQLNPTENKLHQRFLQLVKHINSWVMECDDKKDDFCYVLMMFILFFDLDNGNNTQELNNPEGIEAARLMYVQMLKRYLQKRYPEVKRKKFLNGIMLPSLITETIQLASEMKICPFV